jgi:hypothetical protein
LTPTGHGISRAKPGAQAKVSANARTKGIFEKT